MQCHVEWHFYSFDYTFDTKVHPVDEVHNCSKNYTMRRNSGTSFQVLSNFWQICKPSSFLPIIFLASLFNFPRELSNSRDATFANQYCTTFFLLEARLCHELCFLLR